MEYLMESSGSNDLNSIIDSNKIIMITMHSVYFFFFFKSINLIEVANKAAPNPTRMILGTHYITYGTMSQGCSQGGS